MYIILIEGLGGDAVFAFLASCDGARFTPLSDDHGHGKHWRTLHLLQGEMSGFVMGTSSMTESFFLWSPEQTTTVEIQTPEILAHAFPTVSLRTGYTFAGSSLQNCHEQIPQFWDNFDILRQSSCSSSSLVISMHIPSILVICCKGTRSEFNALRSQRLCQKTGTNVGAAYHYCTSPVSSFLQHDPNPQVVRFLASEILGRSLWRWGFMNKAGHLYRYWNPLEQNLSKPKSHKSCLGIPCWFFQFSCFTTCGIFAPRRGGVVKVRPTAWSMVTLAFLV